MRRFMVTGGAGFIGSAFVRHLLDTLPDTEVLIVDALTYAADADGAYELTSGSHVDLVVDSITNAERMRELMQSFRPDAVVNFAAESHVDNSIACMRPFFETNVDGTVTLLQAFREYCANGAPDNVRYLQVSTDEVYGSLTATAPAPFSEASPLQPRNPYAASKASADLAVLAAHTTYQLPVLIGRCSNNFGPRQSPEKLIPKVIYRALSHQEIPVYGTGEQRRDWIYVEDHVRALVRILQQAEVGSVTNISVHREVSNLELISQILALLSEYTGVKNIGPELVAHVADRPGHDVRYALATKRLDAMGWRAAWDFDEALHTTVRWYVENYGWLEQAQKRLEQR